MNQAGGSYRLPDWATKQEIKAVSVHRFRLGGWTLAVIALFGLAISITYITIGIKDEEQLGIIDPVFELFKVGLLPMAASILTYYFGTAPTAD